MKSQPLWLSVLILIVILILGLYTRIMYPSKIQRAAFSNWKGF